MYTQNGGYDGRDQFLGFIGFHYLLMCHNETSMIFVELFKYF